MYIKCITWYSLVIHFLFYFVINVYLIGFFMYNNIHIKTEVGILSNTNKEKIINELTSKANRDTEVSDAIKEIAESTGIEEKNLLKAFVTMEVNKELKARNQKVGI